MNEEPRGGNTQPSDADLARALQLAAKAALGGEDIESSKVSDVSGHASPGGLGSATLVASRLPDELCRTQVMPAAATSGNGFPTTDSPFGQPAIQARRSSFDGTVHGQHRYRTSQLDEWGRPRLNRSSFDNTLPCLGQRHSRQRSSVALSSDNMSTVPAHVTAAALGLSTQLSGCSSHSGMHSHGVSTGSVHISPVTARRSIDVVRPSLDRSQLERTTYEDMGPPTIIRDVDGQEYLIQPIRESVDRSGMLASAHLDRPKMCISQSGSLGQSLPSDLQAYAAASQGQQRFDDPHIQLAAQRGSELTTPFSNLFEGAVAPTKRQSASTKSPKPSSRRQSIDCGSKHGSYGLVTDISRMNLSAETASERPTSIDEREAVDDKGTGFQQADQPSAWGTPSRTLGDDVSTTHATNSGASGGHVGQMYLDSLRHSAPVSIGVGGQTHGPRISASDVYQTSLFRHSDFFGGSQPASLENKHNHLNQQTDHFVDAGRLSRTDPRLSDSSWEIDIHDIHFGPRIGRGAYGEVFKCVYRETDVAVKLFIDQDISDKVLEAFRKEVDILKKLRHPNILHFMGYCTVPPHMCIVTEYEPHGSLFKLLHRNKAQLDIPQKLKIALDVAIGMHYLHTSKPPIVHGDLKSPNLLLGDHLTVKICDFGLSRFRMASKLSAGSKLGTPEWTAPEVLQSSRNSEAGDVYSYGVVLWELFTGKIPWEDVSAMQVVLMVGFHKSRLTIPTNIPAWAAELIEMCFKDADERPSFAEIIAKLRDIKTKLIDLRGVSRNSGEGI